MKVSKYGVFSCPYFAIFRLNTGKYGPEKTPYLDIFHAVWGSGLVVRALDSQSRSPGFKTTGQVESVFHPSEIDQMNSRNSWVLSGDDDDDELFLWYD